MKAVTLFIVLAICFGFSGNSFSQNSQQLAQVEFISGEKDYSIGEYKDAIDHFEKSIRNLGKRTTRVQYYICQSYYRLRDDKNCLKSIRTYFSLTSKTDAKYKEIALIYDEIQERIKIKEQAKKDKLRKLQRQQEAAEAAARAKEDAAWEKAKDANYTSAYYKYIDAYPNGRYAAGAKRTVSDWDKAAYEKAKEKNSSVSYEYYLKQYPRGNYRISSKKRKVEALDREAWQSAKRQGTIAAYSKYYHESKKTNGKYKNDAYKKLMELEVAFEKKTLEKRTIAACEEYLKYYTNSKVSALLAELREYAAFYPTSQHTTYSLVRFLKRYPNSQYKPKAEELLQDLYPREIQDAFDAGEYQECKNLCTNYQYKYGKRSYAQSMFKKCENKLAAEARKRKRQSKPDRIMVDLTHTENALGGIMLGTLNNRKLGTYYSFMAAKYTMDGVAEEITLEEVDPLKLQLEDSGIIFGLTKKLFRPFWLTAGVGMGYSAKYYQGEYLLVDSDKFSVAYEYGAIMSVGMFNVSAKRTKYYYGWANTFSVGFSFK
jgi:hypothetical protein